MIRVRSLFACGVLFTLLTRQSGATVGDRWSLADDMQVLSNPSPLIDPAAPGGGAATWTYFHGGGNFVNSTMDVPTDVNPEVPNGGIGWFLPGSNHIALIRFDVDANPVPPIGTGDDKTNFGIGDVGGHALIGATWTPDFAGNFLVEWLGYNARNQETANPNEQGRVTTLRVTGPGGDLDVRSITGGVESGMANAYMNSAAVTLAAGESISIVQEGGEWVGLNLVITQIPEPASLSLLTVAVAVLLARWLPRRQIV